MSKKFNIEVSEYAAGLAAQYAENRKAAEAYAKKLDRVKKVHDLKKADAEALFRDYQNSCKARSRFEKPDEPEYVAWEKAVEAQEKARAKEETLSNICRALDYSAAKTAAAYVFDCAEVNFRQIEGTPAHYKAVRDFVAACAAGLDGAKAYLKRFDVLEWVELSVWVGTEKVSCLIIFKIKHGLISEFDDRSIMPGEPIEAILSACKNFERANKKAKALKERFCKEFYELESPYTYAAPWLSEELSDSARTYF